MSAGPPGIERVDRRIARRVFPYFLFSLFVIPLFVEAVRSILGRRIRVGLPHVLAFFVGAYLCFSWAFVRPAHLQGQPEAFYEFVRWQLREIVPLVAIFAVVLVRPRGLVDRYARAVMVVGAVIGFLGAIEYLEVLVLHRHQSFLLMVRTDPSGAHWFGAWLRAHNAAGGLYAALSVMSLWWLFARRIRFWVLAGNVLALVLTLSRSGYLGFIVVAIAYFLFSGQLSRRRTLVVAIGVAVGLAVVVGPLHQRFTDAFSPTDFSRTSRIEIWTSAAHDFSANPVFGIGWSNFQPGPGQHAHNSYLQILAELGLVGFTLLALWLGSVVYELSRIRRFDLIAAIAAVAVSAMLDHNFGSPSITAPVFVLAGMAITSVPSGADAGSPLRGARRPEPLIVSPR